MNPIFLDLGIIKIYWYSIMILLGMFIGGSYILKESKRFEIPEDYIQNLIFLIIIFGVIGARLYYVAFNFDYYRQDLISIFKIWEGGLAIHGGIIAGLITVIFYTKKYKVNTLRTLDILAVGLILAQAIGRWGNFFNGEAHGPITTIEALTNLHIPKFIIDGMYINGSYYHPTFLYESLWCLIGFIILILFKRRKYNKIGQVTGLYLIWYGIGRFLIESLRTDSLMFNNLKVAQIVSVISIIIGLLIVIAKSSGSKLENRYNDLENIDEIRY